MTTPVTLRIQQKGYIRADGYQAVQWAVTVPISVPAGSTPIATDPSSYSHMFVVRNVGGYETLERVATVADLANLTPRNLTLFDIRGAGGSAALAGAATGNILTILNPPSTWIESDPPYNTAAFTIAQKVIRAQGSGASCSLSGLTIPSYTFSQDDIGRWVYLSGFTTSGNNGWAQILSYLGNVAQVSKVFLSSDAGNWTFYALEVNPVISGSEPKYFPTVSQNLQWTLGSGSTLIGMGNGGVAYREVASGPLCLATRFTGLMPTPQSVNDLFLVTRQQVDTLQRTASEIQTQFIDTITHTIGP